MYKDFRYTEHTVCDLAIRYPHEHADDINLNTKKYTNDFESLFFVSFNIKKYIYLLVGRMFEYFSYQFRIRNYEVCKDA